MSSDRSQAKRRERTRRRVDKPAAAFTVAGTTESLTLNASATAANNNQVLRALLNQLVEKGIIEKDG